MSNFVDWQNGIIDIEFIESWNQKKKWKGLDTDTDYANTNDKKKIDFFFLLSHDVDKRDTGSSILLWNKNN